MNSPSPATGNDEAAAQALRECVQSGYGLVIEMVDAVRLVKIMQRAALETPKCLDCALAIRNGQPFCAQHSDHGLWGGPWAEVEHQIRAASWYATLDVDLSTTAYKDKTWAMLLMEDLAFLRKAIEIARKAEKPA